MTVTDRLQLRALYPPPNAQAGLKVLAVVREGDHIPVYPKRP